MQLVGSKERDRLPLFVSAPPHLSAQSVRTAATGPGRATSTVSIQRQEKWGRNRHDAYLNTTKYSNDPRASRPSPYGVAVYAVTVVTTATRGTASDGRCL